MSRIYSTLADAHLKFQSEVSRTFLYARHHIRLQCGTLEMSKNEEPLKTLASARNSPSGKNLRQKIWFVDGTAEYDRFIGGGEIDTRCCDMNTPPVTQVQIAAAAKRSL